MRSFGLAVALTRLRMFRIRTSSVACEPPASRPAVVVLRPCRPFRELYMPYSAEMPAPSNRMCRIPHTAARGAATAIKLIRCDGM